MTIAQPNQSAKQKSLTVQRQLLIFGRPIRSSLCHEHSVCRLPVCRQLIKSALAKRLNGSRCHLAQRLTLAKLASWWMGTLLPTGGGKSVWQVWHWCSSISKARRYCGGKYRRICGFKMTIAAVKEAKYPVNFPPVRFAPCKALRGKTDRRFCLLTTPIKQMSSFKLLSLLKEADTQTQQLPKTRKNMMTMTDFR